VNANAAAWQRAFADDLADARRRDPYPRAFVGVIEGYCEGPRCAVRQVVVHVKEYDGPTPPGLTCPACRRQLKLHQVLTLAEHERAAEWEARCSVNVQRYAERSGSGFVPLRVYLDDSLPE
jgi:hypothetical protein